MWAAPAAAASGDLTFESCWAETNAAACSVPSQPALTAASGVAVSPDGTSVYVTSEDEGAISHFQRAADGTLTFRGCVAESAAAGCTVPPAAVLQGAFDVAVSPDGRSVYVAAFNDSAVTEFSRAANGSLTFEGCFAENGNQGCTVPTGGPALLGALGVEVSPDGQSVYVTSVIDSGITHFSRDATGELTFRTCITASAAPGCSVTPSVSGAARTTVSPDGRSLYMSSTSVPGALGHFSRAADGALTFQTCFSTTSSRGCAVPTPAALDALLEVAVSPDGGAVYAASGQDGAITHFSRGTGGFLVPQGCVADTAAKGCDVPSNPALAGAAGLAVSPDGGSVYATSLVDSAVTHFSRGSSGGLNFQSCVADAGAGGCTVPLRSAIGGANAVAISPDGSSAYVTARDDNSVTHLRREPPAVTPPTDPPGTTPDTTAPDTAKGKGPKRKVKTRKRKAKVSFRFSASEPATTFECQLDARAVNPCSSPTKAKVKAKRKTKKHRFTVAAVDAAGNVDQTPVVFKFKVKRRR